MTVVARDQEFTPAADAHVAAHVIGPGGMSATVDLTPAPNTPGTFAMDWTAETPGSYVAEVTAERGTTELGKDEIAFRREDGVAENFHTEQKREVLAKEISYSEAGISVRDTKELWDMPVVFLLLLGLISADWLLRRKWGVV